MRMFQSKNAGAQAIGRSDAWGPGKRRKYHDLPSRLPGCVILGSARCHPAVASDSVGNGLQLSLGNSGMICPRLSKLPRQTGWAACASSINPRRNGCSRADSEHKVCGSATRKVLSTNLNFRSHCCRMPISKDTLRAIIVILVSLAVLVGLLAFANYIRPHP